MIDFFVAGCPIAGGSKKGFPTRGRDGRLHVNVVDSSGPRGREWRAAVRYAAGMAVERGRALGVDVPIAAMGGAIALDLTFYLPRPASHHGKRGLRPAAPAWPTTRPDVLKLARAVEDACTGLLWRDDSQIVDEVILKLYADDGLPIGVRVRASARGERRAARSVAVPSLPGLA